jgi:methylmalonyl-CoA mutase cobalamin-binding subunit
MTGPKGRILGAALGNDVHVAGIINFLRLAEEAAYDTEFLGPARPIETIIAAAVEYRPDILALSYRLTPEVLPALLAEVKAGLNEFGLSGKMRLVFGGTPPAARVARDSGLFEAVFSGEESSAAVLGYLRGTQDETGQMTWAQTLVERVAQKKPYPVIRHHYGRPDYEETLAGIRQLSEAQVLDVISLGPDQNAQYAFFRPEDIDPRQNGAGGVPLRTEDDLARLYTASRTGNYPLMRCYAGTRDLMRWAEMLRQTIRNAWAAIPLCWYSELDGRSSRPLKSAIEENLKAVHWHAERGIPVEVNEAHHWSLREAPDVVAVVMAYLAAYNAKAQGVGTYVAQYMFNTPNGTSYPMDLGKMLAKVELIETVCDDGFQALREVRTGLTSLSPRQNVAKGQLASSIQLALQLKPDIVHVVAYCEADHAATVPDILESCAIVQGVLENTVRGLPDATLDSVVQNRKRELLEQARVLLGAIDTMGQGIGATDPFSDPATIAAAVSAGLLDAPHLAGSQVARGQVETRLVNGACVAVDPSSGKPLFEEERIRRLAAHLK